MLDERLQAQLDSGSGGRRARRPAQRLGHGCGRGSPHWKVETGDDPEHGQPLAATSSWSPASSSSALCASLTRARTPGHGGNVGALRRPEQPLEGALWQRGRLRQELEDRPHRCRRPRACSCPPAPRSLLDKEDASWRNARSRAATTGQVGCSHTCAVELTPSMPFTPGWITPGRCSERRREPFDRRGPAWRRRPAPWRSRECTKERPRMAGSDKPPPVRPPRRARRRSLLGRAFAALPPLEPRGIGPPVAGASRTVSSQARLMPRSGCRLAIGSDHRHHGSTTSTRHPATGGGEESGQDLGRPALPQQHDPL